MKQCQNVPNSTMALQRSGISDLSTTLGKSPQLAEGLQKFFFDMQTPTQFHEHKCRHAQTHVRSH